MTTLQCSRCGGTRYDTNHRCEKGCGVMTASTSEGKEKIYKFDRYRDGQKMAQGIQIERADNLEQATAKASRLLAIEYPRTDVLVFVGAQDMSLRFSDHNLPALRAKLARVEAERDALSAHVEKLHGFLQAAPIGSGVCCCGDDIANHADPMSCGHSPVDEVEYSATLLMEESPTTSLARRDARIKAEALEAFREEFELHVEVPDFILGSLEEYAEDYRQQTEADQ